MTQSGGQGTYPTYPGFNFSGIGQDIQGIVNPIGGQAGNEKPEWDFPMGIERVPTDIQEMFLRGDAGPSGLNEFLQSADPKVVDRFRSAINMGILVPRNQSASNLAKGYGGLRAGDQTILGPMMDDMPSGLSPEYWQQANNLISTMVNAKLEGAKQSGYLDGLPTVQREQMMQQMAQGWKDLFTQEFTANESKRANMAQEGLSQQEINNQNMQAMAGLMGGTVNPQTGEFQQTEQGRQFDISQQTEMGGWMPSGQATLGREQQAWNQAKDVANLASNPRNYMEAQMLGASRGGLGGMQPNNQINAAMTQTGQQPGMNPLTRMNAPGVSGAGTMAQAGGPGMPQTEGPPQGGQPPFNGGQWGDWLNQANALQNNARDSMMQGQAGAAGAASNLSPGPGSPGMVGGYPGFQGMDGQAGAPQQRDYAEGAPEPMMWAGGTPGTTDPAAAAYKRSMLGRQGFQMPGQQQAGPALGGPGAAPQRPMGMAQPGTRLGQQPQQFTTSAFTQAMLKNRVVPQSGALQGQGQYMSQQQMQKEFNPNKMRGQDFLRGRDSEQKGFLGMSSAAGYSDEDTLGAMQKTAAPAFKAPTAGRMI